MPLWLLTIRLLMTGTSDPAIFLSKFFNITLTQFTRLPQLQAERLLRSLLPQDLKRLQDLVIKGLNNMNNPMLSLGKYLPKPPTTLRQLYKFGTEQEVVSVESQALSSS